MGRGLVVIIAKTTSFFHSKFGSSWVCGGEKTDSPSCGSVAPLPVMAMNSAVRFKVSQTPLPHSAAMGWGREMPILGEKLLLPILCSHLQCEGYSLISSRLPCSMFHRAMVGIELNLQSPLSLIPTTSSTHSYALRHGSIRLCVLNRGSLIESQLSNFCKFKKQWGLPTLP